MIFAQLQRAANLPAAMLRTGLTGGFSSDFPAFPALQAHLNAADLRRANLQNVQFLDIKDTNDKVAFYRDYLRTMITTEREIRIQQHGHSLIRQIYANRESQMLCRQISILWKVYRTLTANSHLMTAAYLATLTPEAKTSPNTGTAADAAAPGTTAGTTPVSLPTEKDGRAAA